MRVAAACFTSHSLFVYCVDTDDASMACTFCRHCLTLRGLIRLKRRIETLVRTIEKELEGPLKKDKEKRRASAGGGKRKASLDGPNGGGGKVRTTCFTIMAMRHAPGLSYHPCLTGTQQPSLLNFAHVLGVDRRRRRNDARESNTRILQ